MADGHTPRTVLLVSDGTCRTCEQVVKSALVQFGDEQFTLVKRRNVRTEKRAVQVVEEASRKDAIIFYTLVAENMRKAIREASDEMLVPRVDVLGPVLKAFNSLFLTSPSSTPGLFYKSEKEYFDRIDAIDYTLKHDDGARLHEFARADVVLVGVSRVSKSSTCFYLAYRGIRAANVPLFGDREPPEELIQLDPGKVLGLTANIHRLQSVRQARLHTMGVGSLEGYVDRAAITTELRAVQAQMAKNGWRRIDVSYKAIEEIAREVIRLLREES